MNLYVQQNNGIIPSMDYYGLLWITGIARKVYFDIRYKIDTNHLDNF